MPLTAQQQLAVEMIGAGWDMAAIADKLGVKLRELWDWRYEPTFSLALRKQNEALQAICTDRMAALCEKAVKTLQDLLDADNDKVRLGAAKLILDKAMAEKEDSEEDLRRLRLVFARDLLRHLNKLGPDELVHQVRRFAAQAEDM